MILTIGPSIPIETSAESGVSLLLASGGVALYICPHYGRTIFLANQRVRSSRIISPLLRVWRTPSARSNVLAYLACYQGIIREACE